MNVRIDQSRQQCRVPKIFPSGFCRHLVLRNHVPDSRPLYKNRARLDSVWRYDPAGQKRPQTCDLLLNPQLGRKAYPEGSSFSM